MIPSTDHSEKDLSAVGIQPLIKLNSITKSYGPVNALNGIDLTVCPGEVHSLLGENGAGKSTAMRVIKGETAPTSGRIELSGVDCAAITPELSRRTGISMVHQELAAFGKQSVAENLLPGFPDRNRLGFINWRKLHEATLNRLKVFGLDIDPETRMADLTAGQKQIIEVLRNTSGDEKLVILDEPTSSLGAEETRTLLQLIRDLRAQGTSVLFVSHRISEVLAISDRITVLRDGETVFTTENRGLSESDLVTHMVGREVDLLKPRAAVSKEEATAPVFAAKGVQPTPEFAEIDLELRAGEVTGVFGLEGSGTAQLSATLFGLIQPAKGRLEIDGNAVQNPSPDRLINLGVTYAPGDRSNSGLYLDRPLRDTVSTPILDRVQRLGFVRESEIDEVAKEFCTAFAVKAPSLWSEPQELSGGNQQKVLLAAALSARPKVLIANDPTRGVDVGAKLEMHKLLLSAVSERLALLVFSSELEELVSLSDHLIVMRRNAVAGTLTGPEISEEAAMALAAGGEHV